MFQLFAKLFGAKEEQQGELLEFSKEDMQAAYEQGQYDVLTALEADGAYNDTRMGFTCVLGD